MKSLKSFRHIHVNHYKRSTPPISVPLNKLFSGNFPLPLKQSFLDYKNRKNLKSFQDNLLRLLPFYPTSKNGVSSQVISTDIGNDNYINEFVIYPNESTRINYSKANHLIMIHGYGSGLGLFIKNFPALIKDNWVIHAIDLLGYGCSSRPPFTPKNFDEVESWFHDSYKTWSEKRGIPSNNLVLAHSMGGYLMASYGMKYPEFCKKMIMASPGGIIHHRNPINIPSYFTKLWERNISPFSLVRNAHIYGSKLVSAWSYRRFSKLSFKEIQALHHYVYGIFQAPGSGEYMLNYLLKPGAEPRFPMTERPLEKVKFDIDWWYGSDDWMNIEGANILSRRLRNEGLNSTVLTISGSGHHVYLDNYHTFNRLLLQEMDKLS